MKDNPKVAFSSRLFLDNLSDSDWENKWIACRIQEPHNYHDNMPYYVAGQLDISDGSHTASFYVDFKSKEESDKTIESLTYLSKTLEAFVSKLRDSAVQLETLNAGIKTTEE